MEKITHDNIKRLLLMLLMVTAGLNSAAAQNADTDQWIDLFNGKNLDNWMVKFSGHQLGENYKNTFRVEDGLLKVSYDNWKQWNGKYGHLFYDRPFSHYLLRVTYRFVEKQAKGGPGWAFRNNGLMLHCQDPHTMGFNQDYPVSIEAQLLGGDGSKKRPNLNVCTPGTNVVINDTLRTKHCINSSSQTYNGNQWVTVEIEVRGSKIIRHKVDGKTVLKYTRPQLDKRDENARLLINAGNTRNLLLDHGYIALQAESHPTEFKTIQLKVLSPDSSSYQ